MAESMLTEMADAIAFGTEQLFVVAEEANERNELVAEAEATVLEMLVDGLVATERRQRQHHAALEDFERAVLLGAAA